MIKEKHLTLCFVHDDEKILLGLKKRGFGANHWNGYGGKLTEGETIEQAAVREFEEEAGIRVKELDKRGLLRFTGEAEEDYIVHIFKVLSFDGEPVETEEMLPKWFKHPEIPFSDMWPDDEHWLPLFLSGKLFRGVFDFRNDKIISHRLDTITSKKEMVI